MLESRFRSLDGSSLVPLDYQRATLLGADGEVLRHDDGLEYLLTGCGAVALRDAPFAARHPALARLFRGAGSLGMWLGALNPGLAFAGQQYNPKTDPDVAAVGAEQAGAAQHRVRRHLGRVAPAPQLAYVVPIADGTELGIANLDTTDAQIAVYSSAPPVLLNNDEWAQVLLSPGLVLDNAVPVRLTVPAGGFARVTPQAGLFAALKVSGARPGLVHVIAEHTQTVNGHVLTETIPASSLDDMIPAGGDGFLPGPIDITYLNIAPGVLQGFAIVAGPEPAAVDVALRYRGGGNPMVYFHYDLDAWGSVRAADFWRATESYDPNHVANYTLDVLPTRGAVLAYDLLTDTVSGKQATLLAGQKNGETDFAFVAQRLPGVLITEPHMIATPADGTSGEIFWPLFQPRDSANPPIAPNPTQWIWTQPFGHASWDDVIAGSFGFFPGATPNETYGFITGHGAEYGGGWYEDGPRAALLVWNHLRKLTPYGDVGQWMAALRPGDACGGAAATQCSVIGITPNTRLLLANAGTGGLAVSFEFYDAFRARLTTAQKSLAKNQNTALDGLVPSGAVRLVSKNATGDKGSYYLISQTPTGDCDDYQAAKRIPGS